MTGRAAASINSQPDGPTIEGHAGAAGAAAVGAAFYFDTPRCGTGQATIERYSSAGGAPILFSAAGARLATQVDISGRSLTSSAPRQGEQHFPRIYAGIGFTSVPVERIADDDDQRMPRTNPSYPNFFGTSAATPAGRRDCRADALQANSAVTPATIYGALRSTAVAMPVTTAAGCSTGQDSLSGYGFVASRSDRPVHACSRDAHVDAVFQLDRHGRYGDDQLVRDQRCELHGVGPLWSGTLAASGTQTLKPTAVGTDTYSLTCANAAGASPRAAPP